MFFMLKARAQKQNDIAVSRSVFYINLSRYGQWIEDPDLGYAWVPLADKRTWPLWLGTYV